MKRTFILLLILLLILFNCGKRKRRIVNKDRPSEQGTWNVYFNKSIKNPELANGDVELGPKLINRIDQARYYINACFYQLSFPEVTRALIRPKRGVSPFVSAQNTRMPTSIR